MQKNSKLAVIIILLIFTVILRGIVVADSPVRTTILTAEQTGSNQVFVKWKPIDTIDTYQLYKSYKGEKPSLVKTISGTETYTYNFENGTEYTFYVRPVYTDGQGMRIYGEMSAGFDMLFGVKTPKIAEISVFGETSARITWTESQGADGYQLYRSSDGKNWDLIKRVTGNETVTYGLIKGEDYSFALKAYKRIAGLDRYSEFSEPFSFYMGLKAPANVRAELVASSYAVVSWDPVINATGYRLYRSTNDKAYELIKTVYGISTFNYSLESGNHYKYKIAAICQNEKTTVKGDYSEETELITGLMSPDRLQTEYIHGTAVKLSWPAIEGATAYRLYKSTDGINWDIVKTVNDIQTTTYGLQAGELYYFKIRPLRITNGYTVQGELSTAFPYYHSRVSKLELCQNQVNEVTLNWSIVEGAEKYNVYSFSHGERKLLSTEETNCAVVRPAINAERLIVVAVLKNVEGTENSISCDSIILENSLSFSIATAVERESITLAWDKLPMAIQYELQRYDDSLDAFVTIAETDDPDWNDSDIEPGQTYEYRYRARYRSGSSEFLGNWSEPVSVSVADKPVYRAVLLGEASYMEYLNGPSNDIERMSELLSGMTSMQWEQCRQLDSTKNEIISIVNSAFRDATENDISLFYYSGHGVMLSGDYYSGALLTVDYKYIPIQELAALLSGIPGKVIVILDSCGSGAAIYDESASDNKEASPFDRVSECFSPELFNEVVIRAFSYKGNEKQVKSGELANEKFCVLTSSGYEEASVTSLASDIWGGVLTRGITASAGMDYNTLVWETPMPGDVDGNSILTFDECYQFCTEQAGIVQNIGVYPQNSRFALFYK